MTNLQAETVIGRFVIDKSLSKFTARAFASGLLAALGHNPTIAIREFSGEARFDPTAPEKAFLSIRIRANSLEVTDDITSRDRKEMESLINEKVLESVKFPTITFESAATSAGPLSAGANRMSMNGTLCLRGITGRVPVTAQVALIGDRLRASGEFSILQSNYGIPPVSVAGGALKLKDELKFTFDIVARKQE